MTVAAKNFAAAPDRYQRSLAALRQRLPELAKRLGEGETVSQPVVADGDVIDIDLGQSTLYRGDGKALAAEQIAQFAAKPFRFYVNDLTGANLGSDISKRMVLYLAQFLEERGVRDMTGMPNHDGAFVFVLGLGLGHHLPGLLSSSQRFRHLIIVEQHLEFLRHSLAAVEWEELFAEADRLGREIHLVIANTPDETMTQVGCIVRRNGVSFIDGSYVFVHYNAWLLMRVRERLWQWADRAFIANGFFEDEILMLTNAVGNFQRNDCWLLDNTAKLMRPEPVFVVGSGPSVDGALPIIKQFRDQVILISCGTGLRVCLANGITPDFHSELENTTVNLDLIGMVDREFPLKANAGGESVALIASLTVNPALPDHFSERFFFFRDSVTSTRMLAGPKQEILGAAPTVANTAVSILSTLGFTQFYLFGIDCGYREGREARHSQASPYGIDDKLKQRDADVKYPLTVPGNFGGNARTNWVLDLSRSLLADVIRVRQLKAFNCSDGAEIKGARPLLPESVEIEGPVLDRAAIKAELRKRCQPLKAGEFLASASLTEIGESAREIYNNALHMLDVAETANLSLVQFHDRVVEFFAERGRYRGVEVMVESTAEVLPKIAMFFAHRMNSPELEADFRLAFYAEYRRVLEDMRGRTFAVIDSCSEQLPAKAV